MNKENIAAVIYRLSLNYFEDVIRNTFKSREVAKPGRKLYPSTYHLGENNRQIVLFVNPVGMQSYCFIKLAKYLSVDYHVILYTSPSFDFIRSKDSRGFTIADEVAAIESIFKIYEISGASIVGHCSGCSTILRFLSITDRRFDKIILSSGGYGLGPIVPQTDFQKTMGGIYFNVASNGNSAAVVHKALVQVDEKIFKSQHNVDPLEIFRNLSENKKLNYAQKHVYLDQDSFLKYCLTYVDAFNLPFKQWAGKIEGNICLIHVQDDDVTHSECSTYAQKVIKNSILISHPTGGHNAIFDNVSVHVSIRQYLNN